MRQLSFPKNAIVDYIKQKIDPGGWEAVKNKDLKDQFDFLTSVEISVKDENGKDVNIWQALASVVDVRHSVEFMRAMLIEVLSRDAEALKELTKHFMIDDTYFEVTVDTDFLIPFKDKVGEDRVIELQQFFCYARKYFVMILAQKETGSNMVATTAVLLVHAQRMAYNVVTQFITHETAFVLDTLIEGTLGVCCDAKRMLVLHLAPAVLTNLVCLFLVDAYNRYEKQFVNTQHFGPWFLNGAWHATVKLDLDHSLSRPNLADMTDLAVEFEEPDLFSDAPLSKVSFSCLPVRVTRVYEHTHPSFFSLCAFKNITDNWQLEVQYVLSLQGLCRSDQKKTLLKDLQFSHRCLMRFMVHKKFEPLEKYVWDLCRQIRKNYDAIFVYDHEVGYGKVLARILEENSRDIVYGLVLFHADLFNLNSRLKVPKLTLNEFAVRFKEVMAKEGATWKEAPMGVKEDIDMATCQVTLTDLHCIKQMLFVSLQDQTCTIGEEQYLLSTAFLSKEPNSALCYGRHDFWQNDPSFDFNLLSGDFHVKLAETT